jgi:Ni,Fe-hydrogenase III small subunit
MLRPLSRRPGLGKGVGEVPIGSPPNILLRSLHVRHVDAGSCNGCESELAAITNPVYDAQRHGVDVVASPRHADVLTVSGPVTRQMTEALRRTHDAVGEPRWVVAVGDCASGSCPFRGSYAAGEGVASVLEVDAHVPGCPPSPADLIRHLRALMTGPPPARSRGHAES